MTNNFKNQKDILDAMGITSIYENTPINRLYSKNGLADKSKLLNSLRSKIEKVENCDLKKNANRIVFGDGSIIMIIGEGPGQKEDELGKPFVGEAGNLLNKMLRAINIDRKDIYITNVVNFRPPNNRKPEASEILRYSKFLIEHINIIKPKIIILMGSTAMESLYGNKVKITQERGKWKEIIINQNVYKSIITFHPAYLLRQPEKKKLSWDDLKKIKKEFEELNIKL